MARIAVKDMTQGQLKLHFAAKCSYHRADGVRALGLVHRISTDDLREAMLAYEAAAKRKDWPSAEHALLRVVEKCEAGNGSR